MSEIYGHVVDAHGAVISRVGPAPTVVEAGALAIRELWRSGVHGAYEVWQGSTCLVSARSTTTLHPQDPLLNS